MNGKKIDKNVKWQNNGLLWDYHSVDDIICHQFYIINISVMKVWLQTKPAITCSKLTIETPE